MGRRRRATDDGSAGRRAFVTELLREQLDRDPAVTVYACGPPAMLEAVRALCAERDVSAHDEVQRIAARPVVHAADRPTAGQPSDEPIGPHRRGPDDIRGCQVPAVGQPDAEPPPLERQARIQRSSVARDTVTGSPNALYRHRYPSGGSRETTRRCATAAAS